MEAIRSSETSVQSTTSTRCHTPEDGILSPDLFNIYINKAIKEWEQTDGNSAQLTSGKRIQTTLYADDRVMLAKSDDE
jgi:hypothetical protein